MPTSACSRCTRTIGVCESPRNLLERLQDIARQSGFGEIRLEVRTGNHAARQFYRALGYRELSCLPGYYGGRESALRMTRELPNTG